MRTLRFPRLVLLAIALCLSSACGSNTEPFERFDLVHAWEGRFSGTVLAFGIRVEVETAADGRLTGTGTYDGRPLSLDGSYEPPTVYLRMTSPSDTLSFVGEMLTATFISGTMWVQAPLGTDSDRISWVRR